MLLLGRAALPNARAAVSASSGVAARRAVTTAARRLPFSLPATRKAPRVSLTQTRRVVTLPVCRLPGVWTRRGAGELADRNRKRSRCNERKARKKFISARARPLPPALPLPLAAIMNFIASTAVFLGCTRAESSPFGREKVRKRLARPQEGENRQEHNAERCIDSKTGPEVLARYRHGCVDFGGKGSF